jgi:hypothetical protein
MSSATQTAAQTNGTQTAAQTAAQKMTAAALRKRIAERAAAGTKTRVKLVKGEHTVTIKAFPLASGRDALNMAIQTAGGGSYQCPADTDGWEGNKSSELEADKLIEQMTDIDVLMLTAE